MAYDLLIRNGRIVDGSGMPAFRGDVAVKDGKIVEIGKLSGAATRTVDADGAGRSRPASSTTTAITTRRSPGTRCAPSRCDHGATTVIFGNCSLSLAPVRRGNDGAAGRVPVLCRSDPDGGAATPSSSTGRRSRNTWTSSTSNLGVNVGNLIGHTAVRYYVMGDECQKRTATDDEIKAMQDVVRDGMKAGALGFSVSRNKGHFDPQGVHIPALWADEKEIFALGDVLRELGTGMIQCGGGNGAEMKDGLMSRLSRGDRPPGRLQQPRPDDAPPGRVEEAHGARRRDRRARASAPTRCARPNRITQTTSR